MGSLQTCRPVRSAFLTVAEDGDGFVGRSALRGIW